MGKLNLYYGTVKSATGGRHVMAWARSRDHALDLVEAALTTSEPVLGSVVGPLASLPDDVMRPGVFVEVPPAPKASLPRYCLPRSSSARTPGSPASTSMTLVRLDAPDTSVTALPLTPKAAATAASAACVALPSTARGRTRTTRAPACSPPTPGRDEPGCTRTVMRTRPVCRAGAGYDGRPGWLGASSGGSPWAGPAGPGATRRGRQVPSSPETGSQ